MSHSDDEIKTYWRSLTEKHADQNYLDELYTEFPAGVPPGVDPETKKLLKFDRRDFLKVMGFSLVGAMAACSKMPIEKAIPYLIQPEEIVPGKAYWYASTCLGCSANCGITVKNREGRPIKIEGNALSPVNRGGLCSVGQAQVLSLYDSGRLQAPKHKGQDASWQDLDATIIKDLRRISDDPRDLKIVFLSRSTNSPSLLAALDQFKLHYNKMIHVTDDAESYDAIRLAHEQAFGLYAVPGYRFDRADLIVSLDADFLGTWLSPVEFTKQFSKSRNLEDNKRKMTQLIQFESHLSLTGSNADYRHAVKPSEIDAIAARLLWSVDKQTKGDLSSFAANRVSTSVDAVLNDLAQKLVNMRGRSLVVSGSENRDVQLMICRINELLENYGRTVDLDRSIRFGSKLKLNLATLITQMESGKIGAVIIDGCNPVYDSPLAESFLKALKKVDLTVSLNGYLDETAKHVSILAPNHHPLESWGDFEPHRGVFQTQQPVIRPIYKTRSTLESLLSWSGDRRRPEEFIQSVWQEKIFPRQHQQLLFNVFWKKSLQDGVVSVDVSSLPHSGFSADIAKAVAAVQKSNQIQGYELKLYEKISMRDGQNANNPWLQEVPDPISKVTWDNYVNLSIADAKSLSLTQGDVVKIEIPGISVELPVNIQPGHVSGAISIALGYGRTDAGRVGNGVGKNVYPLLIMTEAGRQSVRSGIKISKTGQTAKLAMTQTHYALEGRPIFRETTFDKFVKNPSAGNKQNPELVMLWEQHENRNHSWGMAIDTSMCTGCSGCLVGCQSENNVPVVGKEEVFLRREMHWIRIDRYYQGDEESPDVAFQPMMCQHCANAPCESVCPVLATVHSSDGLNQQVYNRCVGTRYCANNCPYKVRRFNWFDYANNKKFDYYMNDDTGRLVLNPDIVVRSRGVMEKCSMCVQRIQEEKLAAKRDGRKVNPDDIKLACQQSCPADAIVFGDLNDPESRLFKLLDNNKRRYQVLGEINVKPGINYLTKVRNKG